MEKLRRYYETLEVEPGSSFEEVKRAFRDLVNVWHPDRFANNLHLYKKAEEKLKEINAAFDKISTFFEDYGGPEFARPDFEEMYNKSGYQEQADLIHLDIYV